MSYFAYNVLNLILNTHNMPNILDILCMYIIQTMKNKILIYYVNLLNY